MSGWIHKTIIFICVLILLFSVGFVFDGEISILYYNNIQDYFYQASFYFEYRDANISSDEVLEDFILCGRETNVDFFFISNKPTSLFRSEIIIYCSDLDSSFFHDNKISKGEYNSLFMGETIIDICPLEEIKDMDEFTECFFVGGEGQYESFCEFKKLLIDKYGGGFPKEYNSNESLFLNVGSVWLIIIGLYLLLSFYTTIRLKKEIAIKMIMGVSPKGAFLVKSLTEIISIIGCMLLLPLLLSMYTNCDFLYWTIIKYNTMGIICIPFINYYLVRVNYKKDLSVNTVKLVVIPNYIIGTIVSIGIVISLLASFVSANRIINTDKQKLFCKEHSTYNYYRFAYRNNSKAYQESDLLEKGIDPDALINSDFYNEYKNKSLQYSDLSDNFNSEYPVILINDQALKELDRCNSGWISLNDFEEKKKVVILHPIAVKELDTTYEIINAFFPDSLMDIEPIEYRNTMGVVGFHETDTGMQSTYYENPILIYYPSQMREDVDLYYAYDIMYNISNEEYESFLLSSKLQNEVHTVSNVLESYLYRRTLVYRKSLMVFTVTLIITILYLLVLVAIINIEYRLNAIEISVKKILGYSIFLRFKTASIMVAFANVLGTVISVIINTYYGFGEGSVIISIGAFMVIVSETLLFSIIRRYDRKKVTSILKGAV